ncbi:hypothetical protein MAUB_41480 [Mycolicibacterium aubagnense]|uniref:Uncharacterized protein n=1 Tax=Mycolicibacterium aubagnense TaxID=319707 RepID=A0ABN5YWJ7_9MYCO|nr:hypothetical protein MAUB_41480 [Mycolicibacterium aubagnense]
MVVRWDCRGLEGPAAGWLEDEAVVGRGVDAGGEAAGANDASDFVCIISQLLADVQQCVIRPKARLVRLAEIE